jgi:hypothetical protein
MNLKSAGGLTLVELIVVIVILLFLASSIEVCPSSAVMQANMTAVGARGKDIWVAVTRENAEREALGLPPLWPRDFDPAVDTNADEFARLDFNNSTDYFMWLYENRLTVTNRVGFDYSRLAGAGVSACSDDKRLSAANNMWIVAKNVRDDMDDIVPVLITRNIDASSLAARVSVPDLKEKALRFDPGWKTPFSDKGFVMIRKGGAIFKARSKCTTYRVVYAGRVFDTALTTNGVVAPPLKYLTPDREVVPGL